MSCQKCKRMPEDLSKMEFIVVDEVNVTPFKYDNEGHNSGDNFFSLRELPKEIEADVRAGKTVKHEGKFYTPHLETGQVYIKVDNEEKFKELYNKYQYVVDFLIKNKGKVLKTVDIPVIFDCFKSNDPDFPCIQSDDNIELYVCLTEVGGGFRGYGNSYSYSIKLASLVTRDPKIVTITSSVSDSGETIVTTTTHLINEKPKELTQSELLKCPRSEIITRWYSDQGNQIYSCDCVDRNGRPRYFSHVFHNFKYVMITKVTPCKFSVTEPTSKTEVHHLNVPLEIKGVLKPGMTIIHDNYIYSYEKNRNDKIEYHRVLDETSEAKKYYDKYVDVSKDLLKYVGVVIKPEELEIEKDVYAEDVPVIYMGKHNIELVIKKSSNSWSRVLTTLATIEFQIVYA